MPVSKNQQLYQKIVELTEERDNSRKEISSQLGISIRTIKNYLSMFRKDVPVEEVRERGRPSKLSDTIRGKITSKLQQDPFSTSKDITRAINENETTQVTERTVRNYLKVLDYQNSLPRNVPYFTDAQKVKHVEWAEAHRQFNWGTVFFG